MSGTFGRFQSKETEVLRLAAGREEGEEASWKSRLAAGQGGGEGGKNESHFVVASVADAGRNMAVGIAL